MNNRLNTVLAAIGCLLMTPLVAFAQLPTPTYGWNLGNTLEPPCGEGCWGPPATQQLINAVKAAGFNTIRIPVAWNSHANQTTYQIDPAWMARVKQVVDWCYAANLYVIINSHWDNGWLETSIDGTVNATIDAKQNAYWSQIATAFVGYDSKLLFAGCNEPNVDTAAQMAELLHYEQTFVNAVRATGGNNSTRWLIIQGPRTDIDLTYDLMNTLPSDPTPGRMMVEVHFYAPFMYTLMTGRDQWWGDKAYFWGQGPPSYHTTNPDLTGGRVERNATFGEETDMDAQLEKMRTKFVSQGIPVLIGEFGVGKRVGYPDLTGVDYDLHLASRTYYNKTLVSKANSKGLRPIYWDNGWAGTDGFALFDFTTGAVVDQAGITSLTGGAALPPPGGGGCTATQTHVDALVAVQTGNGPNKRGQATITVKDNCGNPVANATVTGNFSGTFNESGRSGVTGANGVATITTNGKTSGTVSVTFCVSNITKSGLTYNSSANVVTCDSN